MVGLGVGQVLLGVAQVRRARLDRDLLDRLGALGEHRAAARVDLGETAVDKQLPVDPIALVD